jgi:hypothetical protein
MPPSRRQVHPFFVWTHTIIGPFADLFCLSHIANAMTHIRGLILALLLVHCPSVILFLAQRSFQHSFHVGTGQVASGAAMVLPVSRLLVTPTFVASFKISMLSLEGACSCSCSRSCHPWPYQAHHAICWHPVDLVLVCESASPGWVCVPSACILVCLVHSVALTYVSFLFFAELLPAATRSTNLIIQALNMRYSDCVIYYSWCLETGSLVTIYVSSILHISVYTFVLYFSWSAIQFTYLTLHQYMMVTYCLIYTQFQMNKLGCVTVKWALNVKDMKLSEFRLRVLRKRLRNRINRHETRAYIFVSFFLTERQPSI